LQIVRIYICPIARSAASVNTTLAATADIDRDDDPETIRKQLREARRAVAARRNKSAKSS
jgi:hypothetical protein